MLDLFFEILSTARAVVSVWQRLNGICFIRHFSGVLLRLCLRGDGFFMARLFPCLWPYCVLMGQNVSCKRKRRGLVKLSSGVEGPS